MEARLSTGSWGSAAAGCQEGSPYLECALGFSLWRGGTKPFSTTVLEVKRAVMRFVVGGKGSVALEMWCGRMRLQASALFQHYFNLELAGALRHFLLIQGQAGGDDLAGLEVLIKTAWFPSWWIRLGLDMLCVSAPKHAPFPVFPMAGATVE